MKGKEVKEKRLGFNLTQAELAAHLGVEATTVARWERDERQPPAMLELALVGLAQKLGPPTGETARQRVRDRVPGSHRALREAVEQAGWAQPNPNELAKSQELLQDALKKAD